MDHRYRLPDKVKERQANQIRARFAAYSQATGKKKERTRWLLLAVVMLGAYLFFRWRRGS